MVKCHTETLRFKKSDRLFLERLTFYVEVFLASHFPSPAYQKKSLGRNHGFADEKQGNLFFDVADIIATHRPRAFFLENVKNLVSHDRGNTFSVIRNTLTDLGYSFDYHVFNGKHFVPQNRARTFMIGFDKSQYGTDIRFNLAQIALPSPTHQLKDLLQIKADDKYTLSDKLWQFLQNYAAKHQSKGNGFGYGLVDPEGISRTLSARYYKDGSEILIPQHGKNPRRLTPRECAALQGYPQHFRIPVSDTQAYRQFGNSVVMPLIQAIGQYLIEIL